MKKLFILTAMLAGLSLAGCNGVDGDYDINPPMSGGTKVQRTAILEAINNLSPCVGKSSQDYFPDVPIVLEEDNGDFVKVTTSQIYGDDTVELEWAVDSSQATYRAFSDSDAEHKILEVNYPGFGKADTSVSWVLKSAKCGGAKTKGDSVATYTATIKGRSHSEEEMSIAAINKVTTYEDDHVINGHKYPSTFDQVDYTLSSPYYSVIDDGTNPEYHYVAVKGKVVYYAPDGNWLLLADGKQIVEVYAGSGTALVPRNFPAINNGYVKVHGNLSQYKGNVQIGFVTFIETCSSEGIAEPDLSGTAIDGAFIDSVTLDKDVYGGAQKQAIDGFMNSIGKIVNGTVDPKTITIGESTSYSPISKINSSARFTFEVEVAEGKRIKVAYDYHTDSTGSEGIFNALKAKLQSGGKISLKGTMRYSGNNSTPFMLDTCKGIWNIVPFSAADIS
jgi:uncharacterized lipoprotein NlpE involved in copper resistance